MYPDYFELEVRVFKTTSGKKGPLGSVKKKLETWQKFCLLLLHLLEGPMALSESKDRVSRNRSLKSADEWV